MLKNQQWIAGKIRALIDLLLTEFLANIEEKPVPMEQEMRAGSIAWISAFLPESVDLNQKNRLISIVDLIRQRKDFRSSYWYKMLWLDAACFLLHDDKYYLTMIISNIDHHNSSLRSGVHPPLGLISTKVDLDDQDILQRIKSCLEMGYFYNESLMCILSALKGDVEYKINIIEKWRDEINLINLHDAKILKNIVDDNVISNSLISDEFSLVQRYLFCRLLDPELNKDIGESLMNSFLMDYQSIWNRIDNHPLSGSTIFFNMANKNISNRLLPVSSMTVAEVNPKK